MNRPCCHCYALQGSRPQTPASPAYSHSSYSAFTSSPSQKLPPIHLSTVGRRELLLWINDVLDLDLADISQVAAARTHLIWLLSMAVSLLQVLHRICPAMSRETTSLKQALELGAGEQWRGGLPDAGSVGLHVSCCLPKQWHGAALYDDPGDKQLMLYVGVSYSG